MSKRAFPVYWSRCVFCRCCIGSSAGRFDLSHWLEQCLLHAHLCWRLSLPGQKPHSDLRILNSCDWRRLVCRFVTAPLLTVCLSPVFGQACFQGSSGLVWIWCPSSPRVSITTIFIYFMKYFGNKNSNPTRKMFKWHQVTKSEHSKIHQCDKNYLKSSKLLQFGGVGLMTCTWVSHQGATTIFGFFTFWELWCPLSLCTVNQQQVWSGQIFTPWLNVNLMFYIFIFKLLNEARYDVLIKDA